MPPNSVAGAPGPCLGIAMIAAGGDLSATPPRVERVMRPFDSRVVCHYYNTFPALADSTSNMYKYTVDARRVPALGSPLDSSP